MPRIHCSLMPQCTLYMPRIFTLFEKFFHSSTAEACCYLGALVLCTMQILLHWCRYSCTGEDALALVQILLHWCRYSCTGADTLALVQILLHWCRYSCTGADTLALVMILVHWWWYSCTGDDTLALVMILVHWWWYSCTGANTRALVPCVRAACVCVLKLLHVTRRNCKGLTLALAAFALINELISEKTVSCQVSSMVHNSEKTVSC